jgi:anaerobic magnesium-protoporphyrin IX monomethyl ester cyclase
VVDAVLIHPPNRFHADICLNSAIPVEVVGYGILSIAAYLQNNGYSVKVVDVPHLFQQNFSKEKILSLVNSYDPELVGIELNWIHFSRGAVEMARELKNTNPNIPIIIGGTHASIFKEEILASYGQWIDDVIVGEGELPVLRLLEKTPVSREFLEVDQIPPYDPAIIEPKREGRLMLVNTCRGSCHHSCMYCLGNSTHKLTGRPHLAWHSIAWILEQVQIFIEQGYTDIGLQDPWLGRPDADKFMVSLMRAFRKEGISDRLTRLNMVCLPGTLNSEQLLTLAEGGTTDIDYGCESGSQRILDLIQRPASTQMVCESIQKTAEQGILPITYWMTGFPRETQEDVSLTVQLIKQISTLGGIPHWVTPVIILPGTAFYEKRTELGIIQRMHTFEDYSVYSDFKKKKWAWYPELISHYTEEQSVEDILMNAMKLKIASLECRDTVLEATRQLKKKLYDRHPDWAEEDRMYKSIDYALKSMKGTFY